MDKKELVIIKKFEKVFQETYSTNGQKGDNFVGDLLEEKLGKGVDNLSLPDLFDINTEIKTSQKKPNCNMTGVTKSPCIGKNSDLWRKYGYPTEDGRQKLVRDVYSTKNKHGWYLIADEDQIQIKDDNQVFCSWNTDVIVTAFKEKMPNLYHVKYEIVDGQIRFLDLISYKDITTEPIIKLLNESNMVISIRLSESKSGGCRDRGTAFRLRGVDPYDSLFSKKKILIKSGSIVL